MLRPIRYLLIIVIVLAGILFFIRSQSISKDINESIPAHIVSAFEIIEIVEPYVREISNNRIYELGEIFMLLNTGHRGEVRISYSDRSSPVNPRAMEIQIDTIDKKIIKIQGFGNDPKANPGKLSIKDWTVDSIEAVKRTADFFSNEPDFAFDSIFILTNNYRTVFKTDVWDVQLADTKSRKVYSCTIDPFTGEVLQSEIASQ